MRSRRFTLCTISLATLVSVAVPIGEAAAAIPEPDAIIYGGGTNPFFPGDEVEARIGSTVMATSIVGSIPQAPDSYLLRITLEEPIDGEPRTPGIGRVGDVVSLYLNDVDTGADATIAMRGMILPFPLPVDPDRDDDGIDAVDDNCPLIANPLQEDVDEDGVGDVCDECTDFDMDGFGDPVLAANTCPNDNCPGAPNASQADTDLDGTGDACEAEPVLIVSSDPSDEPDFATVVSGVDAVRYPDTTIKILPGLGTSYAGSFTLDTSARVRLLGVPGSRATVAGSGAGPTIDVLSTSAGLPIEIRHLIIEGDDGVHATVPTEIVDCEFSSISGTAVDLDAAAHHLADVRIASGTTGVDQAAGTTVVLERVIVENVVTGLNVNGTLDVSSSLIADSNTGVMVNPTGSANLDYSTVAGHGVAGVDSQGQVSITRSIVWDNADDLVGVLCDDVQSSDVGTPDCSSVNGNVAVDPLLLPDYHLDPASPMLEFIPRASFDGSPCFDLSGGMRLRDFDRDGLADADLGAYEEGPPSSAPEVNVLDWTDSGTMTWDPTDSTVAYHIYRGSIGGLGYGDLGECEDVLDDDLTDTTLEDTTEPAGGEGLFYLVTAESDEGVEGSSGDGTCIERSRFPVCVDGGAGPVPPGEDLVPPSGLTDDAWSVGESSFDLQGREDR